MRRIGVVKREKSAIDEKILNVKKRAKIDFVEKIEKERKDVNK